MTSYESLLHDLNRADVRYLVVGGLAVVLHGVPRLTADIDLIVDLDPEEAAKAVAALERIGLRPRAPVRPADFADPEIRRGWRESKGMQVFTMFDPEDPLKTVDLFVESPIPFEQLWARSVELGLSEVAVRVVSIPDLIRLKELSGRSRDTADVEALKRLQESEDDDD